MDSKILVPGAVCSDEVISYIASRYSISPEQVIRHFLSQEGVMAGSDPDENTNIFFEENEMAILRDMGICPSYVEFV